jgi:Putative 8-oxoguanine DNA glycosylase OGG-like protein
MIPQELKSGRERYAYVPARLVRVNGGDADIAWRSLALKIDLPKNWQKGGASVRSTYSSIALDSFHQTLLSAGQEEDLIHGLLSVVFWGFASGSDGRINANRALSRCRAILFGRKNSQPQSLDQIIAYLRVSRRLLDASRIAAALQEVQKIKFLGMSFASKVLTFMDPATAAVYDDVISQRLKLSADAEMRGMYVGTSVSWNKENQSAAYERWCHWCLKWAQRLNADRLLWRDWDGTEHNWRTVDIERAFFALGRRPSTDLTGKADER